MFRCSGLSLFAPPPFRSDSAGGLCLLPSLRMPCGIYSVSLWDLGFEIMKVIWNDMLEILYSFKVLFIFQSYYMCTFLPTVFE